MLSDGLRTENYFNYFGVKQWQIWSFLISFSVIAFFFLLGTMVASFGVTDHVISCFNTWIFLPIFLLMVTASWIIVSFYGVGAVMASDYCLTGGSPDATTKAIINQFNIDASQKQLNEYWIVSLRIFLRMAYMVFFSSSNHLIPNRLATENCQSHLCHLFKID